MCHDAHIWPNFGQLQQMQQHSCQQPRHQGGILHRVPAPVAAPAQHFIGPVAANENARPQESPGYECPFPGRFQPAIILRVLPKGSCPVGKRHCQKGIANKDNGGMNGHPGVLQQWIQPYAILHEFRHGQERAFPQHQYSQQGLQQHIHCQALGRQFFPAGQISTHQGVNQQPQQKGALLPCPENRELVQRIQIL